MTTPNRTLTRVVATLLLVGLAALASSYLWAYYRGSPWTRDGRVRADTIEITPDVSGLIEDVRVRDDQIVHKGDVLIAIDQERFKLAHEQAAAALRQIDVELDEQRRENARDRSLGNLVSSEAREQGVARLSGLLAARQKTKGDLDIAELNLTRSVVLAPEDGTVANIELRPGDYATAGKPLFALIATRTLRVEGYFEETRLDRITIGDRAEVRLMGDSRIIKGHVVSIAGGVEDRDRASSDRLLANVSPTFNWVRLAQRIPVRVAVDEVPAGMQLVTGRTATVRILPPVQRP